MCEQIERIPLRKRLESVTGGGVDFLNIFPVFWEDYFEALSTISENAIDFQNFFEKKVKDYMVLEKMPQLCKIGEVAEALSKEEKYMMIYRILIEPFVMLKELQEDKEKNKNE